ncbi:MAG: hypothetical protein IJ620_06805 [Bacteroidales bacterium]|nr:hypothetical protein [Bacteroidales bacterium]
MKKKKKKVPLQVLAARMANRELEQERLGSGFHAKDRAVRNKKRYTRKTKHKGCEE